MQIPDSFRSTHYTLPELGRFHAFTKAVVFWRVEGVGYAQIDVESQIYVSVGQNSGQEDLELGSERPGSRPT